MLEHRSWRYSVLNEIAHLREYEKCKMMKWKITEKEMGGWEKTEGDWEDLHNQSGCALDRWVEDMTLAKLKPLQTYRFGR